MRGRSAPTGRWRAARCHSCRLRGVATCVTRRPGSGRSTSSPTRSHQHGSKQLASLWSRSNNSSWWPAGTIRSGRALKVRTASVPGGGVRASRPPPSSGRMRDTERSSLVKRSLPEGKRCSVVGPSMPIAHSVELHGQRSGPQSPGRRSLGDHSGSELFWRQVVARRTRSRPVQTCDQSVALDSRKPSALEVSARDLQGSKPPVRRNLCDDVLRSRRLRPERHCPATIGCLRCRHTAVVFDRPHRAVAADLTKERRRLCSTETHTTKLALTLVPIADP